MTSNPEALVQIDRRRRQYRSLEEYFQPAIPGEPPAGRWDEFPPDANLPPEVPSDGISRRRFLSLLSASAALALGSSACSRIDRGKIVPYTRRPGELIPGVASYYASTFQEGLATHGVLVKTREGRPIHLEGNEEHPLSRGKTHLRAVADILGLYDPDRLRQPSADGAPSTWEQAGLEVVQVLKAARDAGRPVLLLTHAVLSPTCRALIDDLRGALPGLRHASWEPAASQGEIEAARSLFGGVLLPRMRVDRADVILSLQADFLGSDANAPGLIREFAARRRPSAPGNSMTRLWVAEGCMTLTGANADERLPVRPSRIAPLAFALARHLNEALGVPLPPGLPPDSLRPFELGALAAQLGLDAGNLRALAEDLKRAGRAALVVAGPALAPEAHAAGHLLNSMLGAEGHTVDTATAPACPEVLTPAGLRDLLDEAARGGFAAAIFWGTNPAHSFPQASRWKAAVSRIPMKIRIGLYEDETAVECRWRLPENHWLESWGDFEAASDLLSLRQPTAGPLHDTRQGEDILLSWIRGLDRAVPGSYMDYLKARWQRDVYPAGSPVTFDVFWNAALHDGVLTREVKPRPQRTLRAAALAEAIRTAASQKPADGLELLVMPNTAVYDGRYANNGWLNELPDPVTKVTWGNPLLLALADARQAGIKDGDVVRVSAGEETLEVPAIIQPGQAAGVAGLASGFGRRTGNVAAGVGVNAFALADPGSGSPYLRTGARLSATGENRAVPRTQEHFRMEGRDLARSWTLGQYGEEAARPRGNQGGRELSSLIPAQEFQGHKWGMVIDLSACVGCSGCVIACQSENNIPVVGPERVLRSREMHWIRVDRYYEGDPEAPSVIHQPIVCQQCDDAPCEIVCPVGATTHSPDGLNQMTYNRCVGTRYCSNNCPFKVRRFNFFDYTSMKKEPEILVFNPEVTVRPRGVMEKCTFCVQRIEDVKQRSKVEGRQIRDGEIRPACAAACPAEAIVFGDLNDPDSRVSRMSRWDRGYKMLEELGIKPSVTYLADISNPVHSKGKA